MRDAAKVAGVGDDDGVVLVLTEEIEALGGEDAEDLERNVADADGLPEGIFVGEKLVGDGLADDGHLAVAAHVLLGEHGPVAEGPDADIEVFGAFAHDRGVPVQAIGQNLGAVAQLRADGDDPGDFTQNGLGILGRQAAGGAPAAAHAAAHRGAGENADDVLAETGNLALHLGYQSTGWSIKCGD